MPQSQRQVVGPSSEGSLAIGKYRSCTRLPLLEMVEWRFAAGALFMIIVGFSDSPAATLTLCTHCVAMKALLREILGLILHSFGELVSGR